MQASNPPATHCTCAFFMSVVLVEPQPIGVCILSQLTNCSVLVNSCSYVSLLGETTSIFNYFESPCQSEKLKASSWVINLSGKNTSTETFLCIVRSTQSVPSMLLLSAASASWDIFVAPGRIYNVAWRLSWKWHITKGKAIGSALKIFHFMGCETPSSQHLDIIWVETLFEIL